MSKAATKTTLEALHDAVAAAMTRMLQDYQEINEQLEAQYKVLLEQAGDDPKAIAMIPVPIKHSPSAAELNAITKFLKDNEVTAAPGEGELGKLEEELKEHRRRKAIPPSPLALEPYNLSDLPLDTPN